MSKIDSAVDFSIYTKDNAHSLTALTEIFFTISTDEKMLEATKYGYGIRILKQELWETI